jgi:signal transduction histidine kinase
VTSAQHEKLERITANAWHLERMVKEILVAARGDGVSIPVARASVDLAALVRQVARSTETLALAKGLTIVVEVPEDTTIVTDATKLHQILLNLLGNAIRYTDHGRVTLRGRIDPAGVVLEVEDSGIGIAPEHLDRVFERFWQVDQSHTRVRGGAGLGLIVSRDLARALGGEIEVDSTLGRGSTFRVLLPRGDVPAAIQGGTRS